MAESVEPDRVRWRWVQDCASQLVHCSMRVQGAGAIEIANALYWECGIDGTSPHVAAVAELDVWVRARQIKGRKGPRRP